jgi:hypothetical protein
MLKGDEITCSLDLRNKNLAEDNPAVNTFAIWFALEIKENVMSRLSTFSLT